MLFCSESSDSKYILIKATSSPAISFSIVHVLFPVLVPENLIVVFSISIPSFLNVSREEFPLAFISLQKTE
jgi:hypothetical protein